MDLFPRLHPLEIRTKMRYRTWNRALSVLRPWVASPVEFWPFSTALGEDTFLIFSLLGLYHS